MTAEPKLGQPANEGAPSWQERMRGIQGATNETKNFFTWLLGLQGPSRDRHDAERFRRRQSKRISTTEVPSMLEVNEPFTSGSTSIRGTQIDDVTLHQGQTPRWAGCVVYNGRLFAAPYNDSSVLVFNPLSTVPEESITLRMDNFDAKWVGAAILEDRVYFAPHDNKAALVIDPSAPSDSASQYSFIHEIARSRKHSELTKKYAGIAACNGKLFCAPFNYDSVLVIEPMPGRKPKTRHIPTRSGLNKWHGIAELNGSLYACPHRESSMLVVNASSDESLIYIDVLEASEKVTEEDSFKWSGIVAHSGKLYCCPHEHNRVLVVEPNQLRHEVSFIDINRDESYQGIISCGSRLFCAPYNGSNVLVIDPQKSGSAQISFIDIGPGVGTMRFSGLCNISSSIYLVPFNETNVVKLVVPPTNGPERIKDDNIIEALNDNPLGVDRLGYRFYAKAIVDVLKTSVPPICVGLYAQWGQGKSFMMNCLKLQFDPTARADALGLKQYFEDGYETTEDKNAHKLNNNFNDDDASISDRSTDSSDEEYDASCGKRCSFRFRMLASFIGWSARNVHLNAGRDNNLVAVGALTRWKNSILESTPYWFIILVHILGGTVEDIQIWILDFWRGRAASIKKEELINDLEQPLNQRTEYCFIDFNAWLFAGGGGEIWAGLIRELWHKTELRISKENSKGRLNFKTLWRVNRAEEELISMYGSQRLVRLLAVGGVAVMVTVLCLIVSEVAGYSHFILSFAFTTEAFFRVFFFVALCAPVGIRSSMMLAVASLEGDQSRGDAIFEEATQESSDCGLGFMDHVQQELRKLFAYMSYFQAQTGTTLNLVLFIDDLDRCLDGKSVRVLEALTLMLSPASSPVICFLAVDPRIVVGAINRAFESSLDISKARVSGQEYLEKLVQIPFSLPAPSKGNVEHFIRIHLGSKKINPTNLAGRIRKFVFPKVEEWLDANSYVYHTDLYFSVKKNVHHLDDVVMSLLHKEARYSLINIDAESFFALNLINSDLELVLAVSKCLMKADAEGVMQHWNDYMESLNKGDIEASEKLCTELELVLSSMQRKQISNSMKKWSVLKSKLPDVVLNTKRGSYGETVLSSQKPTNSQSLSIESSKTVPGTLPKISHDFPKNSQTIVERESGGGDRINIDLFESSRALLPEGHVRVFTRLAPLLDANPRRIKRIMNVYQVIYGVAKATPLHGDLRKKVVDDVRWPSFAAKLIKWVCLCEMYPYRISYLVQFIMDHTQKVEVNKIIDDATVNERTASSSGLFKYFEMVDRGHSLPKEAISLNGGDHIATVFAQHVERYLYYDGSQALSVLDSDPERFWALMCIPFPSTASEVADSVYISVQDILGPEMHDYSRAGSLSLVHYNPSFSLLHYSFNLNPTLRQQIAVELHELVSSCELRQLKEVNGRNVLTDALPTGGVTLKSKLLTRGVAPVREHMHQSRYHSPVPTPSGKKPPPPRSQGRFNRDSH